MTNVEAIAKIERGYYGENGIYPAASLAASRAVRRAEAELGRRCARGRSASSASRPRARVCFVYDVNARPAICACPSGGCFTATAYGDSTSTRASR